MTRILTALLLALAAFGQEADPIAIIEKVDRNTVTGTASYEAKLIISEAGEVRTKEFSGYVEGKDKGFMEFTAPARDKGTRFLKLKNEMWIYIPAVEKSMKIAGHMLRQSLMGSDFSYDDMMENEKLKESYDITLAGTDTAMGKECWLLDLAAKVEDVSYYKRRMWIDKELYIPLKVDLYAKSGKLMKEISILDHKKISGRNYPTVIKMVNKLRQDTYSEMAIEEIKLDVTIPARVFTKAYLERQ